VLIVLVALGVFLFAVFESRLPQFSSAQTVTNHITFFLLINLNILLLLVFAFLVGRNLVKLVLERRRRILGSHLRTRLVGAFVALSLFPAVLLFIASMNFIENSIEKWFDAQVEKPLQGAHEVVRAYYRRSAVEAEAEARRIAAEIALWGGAARGREAEIVAIIGGEAPDPIKAISVYGSDGTRIAEARGTEFPLPGIAVLPRPLLRDIRDGAPSAEIEALDQGELIRAVVPLRDGATFRGAVIVDEYVPVSLSKRSDEIERSFREYKELKILKQPVLNTYILTLSLITMVVVFAATWYGLALAKGITVPIQRLAEGTREVAQGNWDVHIEGSSSDEIGTLVSAFNQMTADLKKINTELEERRRHMETVLANIRAGVVSVSPIGTVTTVNSAAEKLLGIDARRARGRRASEVFADRSLDLVRHMLEELLATGTTQSERQVELVRTDRAVTLLAAAAPLRDPRSAADGPVGAVLFFEDITELVKVQRMEAWREVAQRIAHEIKNPLTPIQLSAQRLHKRYSSVVHEEVFEECTRTIVTQVEALKTLVNEFSNFARLPTGNQTPHDLNAIVEEALVLFREGHREIRFDLYTDASLPLLMLDREGIKRAVINVLDNAVAACGNGSSSGGRIEIRTEFLASLGLVRLELADNGCGMSPEVKSRLFEPYFSTKKEGTGLGLAIVSAIVAEHRAFLRVRDNEPRGSRFIVEFPVREGPLGYATGTSEPELRPRTTTA
jgi:two-component system nitrogen regulation sensor histidine kinase NtrY